jgi:hypothetical protein|tara:strand:- start:1425 stop:2135 length:711 start_codon:yes stop_codon:yes gene_type:complete
MEKSKLQSFINRYYLAGNCEAVILKENDNGVGCELIDMDQTVVGKLQWNTTPFMKGELGINHTGSLIKMLSALGENININVQDSAGKNYAMKISEGSTKATFMLADTTVIPAVPAINTEPPYEVTLPIDDAFMSKFIKAKNALPDAKNFAVQVVNGEIKFIINYSTVNSDNITFEVGSSTGDELSPICFSADKLKEVLVANKGDMGTMHVSSQGLSRIDFTGPDFNSSYWLVQLQN